MPKRIPIPRLGKLEVISFATGFSLMAFELVAARVLAPSIGSSTYVWTSVIGVIIAALSLGFFIGGRLADMRPKETDLVWLLCLTALTVVMTQLMYKDILADMVQTFTDPRIQAVVGSLLLFAPTSFLVGMTSPYLAKLNVKSLKTTGQSVASLDALNALGGITGTFVTGFFLFGYLGSRETLSIVVLVLLATSWLLVPRYRMAQRIVLSVISIFIITTPPVLTPNIVDIDTPSAHYQVVTFMKDFYEVNGLITGPSGVQSAVYKSGSLEPVFWYNQELARLTLLQQPKRVLVLGGGAFTLPQYLAQQLPDSTVDVVEIDPGLKHISEQYFQYKNPKNVELIFDDARSFVQTSKRTYDVVVVDVYGDTNIPFSLITKEYGQAVAKRVKPDGIVVANVIAGLANKPCKTVFGAVDAAYKTGFRYGLYSNQFGADEARANHILLYSRQRMTIPGMKPIPDLEGQLLTDNYAPAERLYYACHQSTRPHN